MQVDKKTIIQTENQHYLPVFSRLPIVLEYGKGCFVYDVDGKKYLDFLAGIAVNALGYGNKVLADAVGEQAQRLIHCSNLFYTGVQSILVDKLVKLSGFDRVFFCNSGAEANEGAIKVARKYASKHYDNKYKIICANHSFHGRTLTTLTATGNPKYQKGYDPLPEGFIHIDFGDIEALQKAMSDDVCAVLLEPVQGEGGVNVATDEYFVAVRKLCDENNALLIFDEIQTGVGRTGKWFAFEHTGIRPDIITLAKGLAGGFPIGAFLTTDKVASCLSYGDHGSTFGGNALACAASNAVLDVIAKDNLVDNAQKMGEYFKQKLLALKDKYPRLIADVRGKGLLIGVQLNEEGSPFVQECLKKGLIINCTAVNVLRLVPPLIVTKDEIDLAVNTLDEVFAQK